MDEKKDILKILECSIKSAKKQREAANEYCESIASVMEELETETGKKMLAEITQDNYKVMLELDMKISLLEKSAKAIKEFL